MGVHETNQAAGAEGAEADRRGMRRVLHDLQRLEALLEAGAFETAPRRIGAEQEMVLVDRDSQPAPVSAEALEKIDDARVVPEIARFNLEFNADPIELGGSCFSRLEAALGEAMETVRVAAAQVGARPLLTGICPTVDLSDLTTENMAPKPRYFALDESLRRLRGSDYELRIDGADELIVRHPNVMLESVNTSFQVHYQTTPDAFASEYNTALAVAGPVLAAAVNSPILFGKRLWRETRIAIFQQVVDTRKEGAGHRELPGRVRFGERWVERSVLELYRADVARFRQILTSDGDVGDEGDEAEPGGPAPKLKALQAFNSSVYRWMRPCYGVADGKPHLRIENRVLPAGPTIVDEVANAALWIGLMVEGPRAWPDLTERLEFREARSNFLRAARDGLSAHMTWFDDELSVRELFADVFLPTARAGLERAGVDAGDAERLLGIVESRVGSRVTGSHWTLASVAKMRGRGTRAQRLDCLTQAMLSGQDSGAPVHEWPLAELNEEEGLPRSFAKVSQCMTTDLFTVGEDDCIDLVASIMDWERLRHIPVESTSHELVGLVSYRMLVRRLANRDDASEDRTVSVSELMIPDPVTVTPDTSTVEAIRLMCEHRVSCLPVVEDGRLVGIISERDFAAIARGLLERMLREDSAR